MESVIEGLIERFLEGRSGDFVTRRLPADNGRNVYGLDSEDGKIVLCGDCTLSYALALGKYMEKYLNACIGWCGDMIDDVAELPLPEREQTTVLQEHRAYMNYCTFSYSCAWWGWERWQREIDMMALKGVNMPLAIVGVEKVWYETLRRLDFTEREALDFLCAPSHVAWQFMSNLEGVLPPPTVGTVERRYSLGRKILDRMLEYGMTPIQQGFAGYVPRLLKEKTGSGDIRIGAEWCSFKGSALLDPTSLLFMKVGGIFMEEQKRLFGLHGYYACDPFHESTPPVKGKKYLRAVARAVCALYAAADPDYTWVMQGWTPYRDIIRAVEKDRLLVLDLSGAHYRPRKYFWHSPFVMGNLHNFGGRINLHGDIAMLAERDYARFKKTKKRAILTGTGLFMEGIEQNPMYYDMAFSMLTRQGDEDLESWLDGYALRRYGSRDEKLASAVRLLAESVYSRGTNDVENSSMICARPALHPKKSGPNNGFGIPYDSGKLVEALRLLLAADNDKALYTYKYDVADISRQILSNKLQEVSAEIERVYARRDAMGLKKYTSLFLEMLKDADRVLAPIETLSFRKWIRDAHAYAHDETERKLYDKAASLLVTLWGSSSGDPTIFDYAWREWSGLISDFYYVRWKTFFDMLYDTLKDGKPYDGKGAAQVHGREAFRADEFYSRLADMETEWVDTYKDYDCVETDADCVETARNILEKYFLMR